MEPRGIYIAFAWLGTIILGIAVQAIHKGPQTQPQPSKPPRQNELGA